MELLNRTNKRLAHCRHCGKIIVKDAGVAVKIDGNTVGVICQDCINGHMELGFAQFPKTTGTGNNRGTCKTTINHELIAEIENPFTALDFTICHGAELIDINKENGNLKIRIADQTSCDKIGHVFSENHLADNFKTVKVNGEICENIDDYHRIVKVWG